MPDREATPTLPSPIRAFVRQHIQSLHQLEILLLVYTPPLRPWQADEIARQLYLPAELCAERLADFATRGLLQCDPAAAPVVYHADPEQVPVIDQLAAFYRQQRVTLTAFLFSQPNDTIQSFADAFKFRKES